MNYLKQLIFGVIYLIMLGWMVYLSKEIVTNPWIIFDLGWRSLIGMVIFDLMVGLSGLFFGLSVVMSKEKLIDIGIVVVGGIMPITILGVQDAVLLGAAILISEMLALLMIRGSLRSYLSFSANNIVMPGIKNWSLIVLIGVSIIYGVSFQTSINTNGFKLPDEIVDSAIKLSGGDSFESGTSVKDSLTQNPTLLQQFGLTPEQAKSIDSKMIDGLIGSSNPINQTSIIKDEVNKQLSNAVAPVLPYIGILMGGLFLITMLGIIGFINLIIGLSIWAIFRLMEATGMIHFEKEMREVRKLVV